jgi:uncharacterized protein (DUF1778 family)
MKPLKDQRIELRLTADEKKIIEEKAQQAGIGVSDYLRQVALGIEVNQLLSKDQHRTLVGLANNLNQLTRFAHAGRLNLPQIHQLLAQLKKLLT